MAPMLDILQSVIVAGIIVLLVLGIHLMTMKTGTENRVLQEMQGLLDVGMEVFQEEFRHLDDFTSDHLKPNTNDLYFNNTNGEIVYIKNHTDSLTITKTKPGSQTSTGTVKQANGKNSIDLNGSPSVPSLAIIKITSSTPGRNQTKLISSYSSGARRVNIVGEWDILPTSDDTYQIISVAEQKKHSYRLNLLDRKPDIYTFNLKQIDENGSIVTPGGATINADNIDVINVSLTIASREKDLYQDHPQQFTSSIQKDFFLRGYRLVTGE
jgi:hypothetical protein